MKFINYLNKNIFFILFLALGLLFFLFPALSSGFDLIMGDNIKTPYNIYVLEHFWLWLNKIGEHLSFWDAPFSYNNQNMLANSDVLIGLLPFYGVIRFLVDDFIFAYQILFVLCCVLNYSIFYYFLKTSFKKCNFSDLAISFSSFIFAFSVLRCSKSFDIAYFSQFFTILFLIFLFKPKKEYSRIQNHFYFLFASIFITLQFYTAFSLGFFAAFVGFFVVIISLLVQTTRERVLEYFKSFYTYIIFYFLIVVLLLTPLTYHQILLEKTITLNEFLYTIFEGIVWIKSISVLDNLFYFNMPFFGYGDSNEANCSLGIFVMCFLVFSIFSNKKIRDFWLLNFALIFLFSCGSFAFFVWKFLYFITPVEIIGYISNIVFIFLIEASVLCCFGVEYIRKKIKIKETQKNIILILILFLLVVEQIPLTNDNNSMWKNYVLSKKEFNNEIDFLEKKISKKCDVLYIDLKTKQQKFYGEYDLIQKQMLAKKYNDILAMFITLKKPLKVINGYFDFNDDTNKNKFESCVIFNEIDIDKI